MNPDDRNRQSDERIHASSHVSPSGYLPPVEDLLMDTGTALNGNRTRRNPFSTPHIYGSQKHQPQRTVLSRVSDMHVPGATPTIRKSLGAASSSMRGRRHDVLRLSRLAPPRQIGSLASEVSVATRATSVTGTRTIPEILQSQALPLACNQKCLAWYGSPRTDRYAR